ncbi:cytochrome P450 monooxygenase-like protein [Dothistroma septosporum NZE10]|uniref:Cytochrome P450 monooxygenase-like protein n=1 Tax=Dothistroma septosporum (strain NZE10 / CBS 128990) TaxID=675120 RepID=M2YMJ9_DOTSN|nr:cytochrome P450 monooxygenase-like protein [Dothistroma septosporum NZE10]
MPSLLTILGALVLAYSSTFIYNFIRNLNYARKSGMPYFIVPWDQNHFIWMIASVPLRPTLKRHLPTWIYERLALTIYGFEFHEGLRPYKQYGAPQGDVNNLAMVSTGKFEFSTRDPEVVNEILKRPRDFLPHEFTTLFMARFGHNVLTSDGDSWARQRKVVASTINERISRTVFKESIEQTQGLLGEVIGNGEEGETAKLFDMMKKITINVLSGAGMGTSVPWSDEENARLKPKEGFRLTYMEAVKVVIDCIAGPIILPKWFLDNYPSFLPGHKLMKSLSYALDEFPSHTMDLLEQEKQRTENSDGQTRSNIMSQLLQASEGDKGGKALSDDEMMGNLFIFTAAGFDTTANTLSYALVLLARYPQWQQWIFEEIDKIMPEDPTAELDYTGTFPEATRVLAIMLETLRLYAPVIHLSKMTRAAQTLNTARGTLSIPANTTVYVNICGLHVDPNVYRNLNLKDDEKPSSDDETLFRPTRWLNNTADGSLQLFQPPKGSFIPWSGGPRICPGQKMAQVEFVSIFLSLFRKHEIQAVPLKVGTGGKIESKEQIERRLDARMRDSISILTLQMNDVYNVPEGSDKGLRLRLLKRKK